MQWKPCDFPGFLGSIATRTSRFSPQGEIRAQGTFAPPKFRNDRLRENCIETIGFVRYAFASICDRVQLNNSSLKMKSTLKSIKLRVVRNCLLAAVVLPVIAFPPAPHHRFYGQVRDEQGNRLSGDDGYVILETSAGVQLGSPIAQRFNATVNYQLDVPMDSGITDDAFKPTALKPTVPFTIKVRVGNRTYLPIELGGDFALNAQPGAKTRLDLTLGEDLDGDGLPDAWERLLIGASRGTVDLEGILPTGDFDGDGMSNFNEYLAGTYAFDNEDGYSLEIIEKKGSQPVLEFTAVRGRNYSVYGSENFKDWFEVQFRIEDKGKPTDEVLSRYDAKDSRLTRVQVVPGTEETPLRFFKLMIE